MSNKPSMEELLKQKINNHGSNNESSKQSNTENEKSKRHTRQGENNTSEKKKSYKDLKPNISELKENLTRDKIVDYIRDGKGRYYIGGVILILLLAYLFGIFNLLTSPNGKVSVNPFTAIFSAFTSGGFFTFLVLVIVIVSVIRLCMIVIGKNETETDREFGYSDALGSGGRATEDDKEKLLIRTNTLDEQPYLVFGKEPETGKYVGINPKIDINHNSAVCGPQQSGKSFKFTKNNLVQLMKNEQSVIVTDPKGEMYRDMSPVFEQNGYIVKQLNVNDFYSSDSWNILHDVNEDNIDEFARTFVENLSDGKEEATYIDMKFSLFKALCLYVLYEEKDIDDDERTLGHVYEILASKSSETELDSIFLELDTKSKARQTYINWSLGGRLKTNSLATLAAKLQIFQRDALKEVTGTTDIDILLPGKEKCAYFIVLDDQNNTYSCIVSVFIKLIIEKAVWYAKRQATGKTDRRIHMWLEEFPTICRIPDFEKGLGTWRGYGIDITVIFQNIPQMMNRYPDNVWNAILGACSIQVCLGAYEDGDITAEHYAKMGGVGTVILDSERRNFNKLSLIDTKAYTQVSVSENMQQAQAIYPSEVKDLILNEEMFVTIGGSKPFKFKKIGYNENKYFNTPPKPTFENIPFWLLKLKDRTDFTNEYGGVYKLGRLDELPPYILDRIAEWKNEVLESSKTPMPNTSKEKTSSIPTPAKAEDVINDIKTLDSEQERMLLDFLEKLKNNEATETVNIEEQKTSDVSSARETIEDLPSSCNSDNEKSVNAGIKPANEEQEEKEQTEPEQQESKPQHGQLKFSLTENTAKEQQGTISTKTNEQPNSTVTVLGTNGKPYVIRDTETKTNTTPDVPEKFNKKLEFDISKNTKNN